MLKNQLEVEFFKSVTFLESIFTQKFEHILSCYVSLACPIYSLEKHNWTELFHESFFKVKSEIQKVSLALHQRLLRLNQGFEEFAKQELCVALLVRAIAQFVQLDHRVKIAKCFISCHASLNSL